MMCFGRCLWMRNLSESGMQAGIMSHTQSAVLSFMEIITYKEQAARYLEGIEIAAAMSGVSPDNMCSVYRELPEIDGC